MLLMIIFHLITLMMNTLYGSDTDNISISNYNSNVDENYSTQKVINNLDGKN